MAMIKMRRALLSVSDKAGLVDLARVLVRHGVELLSTGGTCKAIAEAGLPVTEISDFTGFPEMLDGRVKTLHPKVHGGILHRRDVPEHLATIAKHGIEPIDMVVVNLYPFEATVARPGVTPEEAIEQIDIGGPSMVRSAAKNHSHVAVVTDAAQYGELIAELDENDGSLSTERLRKLAVQAFQRTSTYDRAIHAYLANLETPTAAEADSETLAPPASLQPEYSLLMPLRYGENPHQAAAFYVDPNYAPASIAKAKQLHGKELSYNNILDLDSALLIVRELAKPAAVVLKHNNPCGAAMAAELADAFDKAYAGDPVSAFGSVIGFNRPVDEATAMRLTEPGRFVEAIVAPSFEPAAVKVLTERPTWKKSVRLLAAGDLSIAAEARKRTMQLRPIEGGLLWQSPNVGDNGFSQSRVVTKAEPSDAQRQDLAFAWTIVKHVKSNAIVLVRNEQVIGVGAGQMSRVDSTSIAIAKANEFAEGGPSGSVLGSDAFFPFRDNVDQAATAGIRAIVQPGGSKRDEESITACDENGIAMLFTGMRHFKH